MGQSNNPLILVLIGFLAGLTLLTLLCFVTLFIAPDLPFNPLSPSRATAMAEARIASMPADTPTFTPVPTYPPTWTPSPTFTPAPTKTPTETRTVTPTKPPTFTPTPLPTATNTRLPSTSTPTVTPTATPFPCMVVSHSNRNNCANIKLQSQFFGTGDQQISGYQVAWSEVGTDRQGVSEPSPLGLPLGVMLIPGTQREAAAESHSWVVYVVKDGQRVSRNFQFATDPIYADNPSYCNDIDDEEEFSEKGCLVNQCDISESTQIKIVNWQCRETP